MAGPGSARRADWPARLAAAARRTWVKHPRWSLAAKGALAATLAWFAGTLAPAPLSEYPYYAPLGAVLATTSTLVRSVRESLQTVAAVLVGAVIARAVDLVPLPGPLAIAVAVGIALLCVGWRIFGEMGAWIVTSAIFVLILGAGEGLEYVGSYAGLIVVGAAIGVSVNLVLPPLPLAPSEVALTRLRDELAEQVEALATGLEDRGTLDPDEWENRRHRLIPTIERTRAAVGQMREASRANRKVRRTGYRDWVESQTRRAGALGTSAEVVDEIERLLVEWERDGRDDLALGRELRPAFAHALRAFATALRSAETQDDDRDTGISNGFEAEPSTGPASPDRADAVRRLDESLGELRAQVREARRTSEQDYFVAGALVIGLSRGAGALGS